MNKKVSKLKHRTSSPENMEVDVFFFLEKAIPNLDVLISTIEDFEENQKSISFHYIVKQGSSSELSHSLERKNVITDSKDNIVKAIKSSKSGFLYFAYINSETDLNNLKLFTEHLISNKKRKSSVINFLSEKKILSVTCMKINLAEYLFESRNQKLKNTLNEINYRLSKLGYKNEFYYDLSNKKNNSLFKSKRKVGFLKQSYTKTLNFFFWFFVLPIQEIKTRPHNNFEFIQESSIYRFLFAIVITLTFFLFPYFSLDAGNSGDEESWQYPQSQKILNYYKSLGADKSYADSPSNFATYGMSFDTVTTFIIQSLNIKDIYEARHIFNSLTGWITTLLIGLLLKKLFDWRAALIAVTLMLFSPRFLGHSWNNPKDIPFAMGFAFSLVYMISYFKEFPQIKLKTIVLLTIGIGLTIGNRVGGLLLIAYFGLFSGLFFLFTIKSKGLEHLSYTKRLKKLLLNFLAVSAGGYLLGLPLWPYALQNPFSKPFEALKILTNYTVSLRQLFEGTTIWSDNVPWDYVPKYFLITTPLIVLVGLIPFLYFWFNNIKSRNSFLYFCIFFSIAFPISYIIYKNSNVYGGLRHSLFVYPSIVAASSIGLYKLLTSGKNKVYKIATVSLSFLLLINPVIHTFANHPLQYVYFNQLVGGVKGAYGKYELDYYFHSLKKASNWFIENELPKVKKDSLIIATNFNVSYYFRDYEDRIKTTYLRYYNRGNSDWDYAIIANTYINPEQLKNKSWPPENTIHTINVDDVPVCAILKREQKFDLSGYQKLRQKDYFGAIEDLKKALQQNKTNEVAYSNLAAAYMHTRRLDLARQTINQLLEIYPKYDKALNLLGLTYFNERNYEEAYKIFTSITEMNPKFFSAYHNLGLVFMRMNKGEEAIKYFQQAIRIKRNYKPSYLAIAQILKQMGKDAEAKKYTDAANKLK